MRNTFTLVGKRNGKLTVIRAVDKSKHGTIWECLCDCGKLHRVVTSNFRKTSSCGCSRLDLTGRRYGRLQIEHLAGSTHYGRQWRCVCDCGTVCTVSTAQLISGKTRSCGCLKIDQVVSRSFKHGFAGRDTRPSEFDIYVSARQRCQNKNNPAYARYGGRGIKFLFDNFPEFLAAVGPRPSKEYSLDRIDNDGNYEVGNLRWATDVEQAANKIRLCSSCRSPLDVNLTDLLIGMAC